jgi:hypothetical protein
LGTEIKEPTIILRNPIRRHLVLLNSFLFGEWHIHCKSYFSKIAGEVELR